MPEDEQQKHTIVLRPRIWTQRITWQPREDAEDATRFLRCEAAIVDPMRVVLEGKVAATFEAQEPTEGETKEGKERDIA